MKIKILLGIALFFMVLGGCSTVNYTAPNGEHFRYSRLGTQAIQGFKMQKNNDGVTTVEFSKQEGGEKIAKLFGMAMATAVKNLTSVPK